ncbi:MAG: hypothetical protein COB34_05640 [Methylophilaceae bacterium]|nr:MAG: hypothetical protein COB34_05640 [Methylophilaceae bacterium]
MDLGLIVQLVSGAVGGNVAGSLMKKSSLGTALNSVVGILGGAAGGQLLGMLGMGGAAAAGAGGIDIATIVSQVAGGGIGGGVLLALVGLVKNAMAKSK